MEIAARASSLLLLVVAGCGGATSPTAPHAPPVMPETRSALTPADPHAECAVWTRETEFAKSVAAHDGAAFKEHVHPAAIFVEGDGTYTKGRDAIAASWEPIVLGKKMRLAWHPSAVAVAADGRTALSRGPYLFEDLRPETKQRFLKGTFQSVWMKDADGAWRVFVDGGTPPPVPATPDEARAMEAEFLKGCPSAT